MDHEGVASLVRGFGMWSMMTHHETVGYTVAISCHSNGGMRTHQIWRWTILISGRFAMTTARTRVLATEIQKIKTNVVCWAFVGRMLGPCWLYVGHMFSHDGSMLGLCWTHVNVGAMLGDYQHLADFRFL